MRLMTEHEAGWVRAEELGENRTGGLPGRIRKVLLFVIVERQEIMGILAVHLQLKVVIGGECLTFKNMLPNK